MQWLLPVFLLLSLLSSPTWAAAPSPGAALTTEEKSASGVSVHVARLDLARARLRVFWKADDDEPYTTLSALRKELQAHGEKFLMATNSGIYSKDLKPLGLHIERGELLRKLNPSSAPGGNFSMVPNGVFFLTATGARVVDSKEFTGPVSAGVLEATQSGPLLLRNGKIHPQFHADSSNRKLRSGVGVDGKGHVVFAISDGGISFYDFARFFKEELGCQDALYLDGSISALLTREEPAEIQPVPFVGIWAATAR